MRTNSSEKKFSNLLEELNLKDNYKKLKEIISKFKKSNI